MLIIKPAVCYGVTFYGLQRPMVPIRHSLFNTLRDTSLLYPPPPPSQSSSGSSSCELASSEDPVLFRPRGSSKLRLSAQQSSWSPPFSVSAVETAGLVVCRDKERHTRYRSAGVTRSGSECPAPGPHSDPAGFGWAGTEAARLWWAQGK